MDLELLLLIILLITNAFSILLFLKYRERLHRAKGKIYNNDNPIPKLRLKELHPAFEQCEFGHSTSAAATIIMLGDERVEGGASDRETWILSVLAKNSKNMFEFGTCTGKTTYLWATNSAEDAKIVTLTLPPEKEAEYAHASGDSELARNAAISESKFVKFLYSGTPVESKITQLFMDSKNLDENRYKFAFDLIFVDGSHAYSFVKSDTEKALKMLKPGGLLLWHDYNRRNPVIRDVYKYLNELNQKMPLFNINGTTLVGYKKPA